MRSASVSAVAICARSEATGSGVCSWATTVKTQIKATMMTRIVMFIALTHLAFAGISYDGAAKTYGPTARFIGEEDPFQRMLCFAAFGGPARSAVNGVYDSSFGPDCPPFSLIDTPRVKQIGVTTCVLILPRGTAVAPFINAAAAADCPTDAVIDKGRSGDAYGSPYLRQPRPVPRVTTVRRTENRGAGADVPAAI